jgi:AcrR family transcriptional regulator
LRERLGAHTFGDLTDQTTGRAQRRPEEKRARLLVAARTIFGEFGYEASVHDICRSAGVGIGTFYHQFPDKADLMRSLMDEEHEYRVRAFDALPPERAGDFAAEVVRVLAGSDPALLEAMIEACGASDRLLAFARGLRKKTTEHLAAALERAREARDCRHPALEASTAAWATLALGDRVDSAARAETPKIVNALAFAETDGERIRI